MDTRIRSEFAAAAVNSLLALVLVVTQLSWAVETGPGTKAHASKGSAQEARLRTSSPDEALSGPSRGEGIKVHGHWIIEVRKPDGRLVARREFENALTPTGASVLLRYLSRTNSTGLWSVQLDSLAANGSPPCNVSGSPAQCFVTEPPNGLPPGPNVFTTLTVSLGPGPALVLQGIATAQMNGNISVVSTLAGICAPTAAPASPCGGSVSTFTSTILPGGVGINVSAGEQVQIVVAISFS